MPGDVGELMLKEGQLEGVDSFRHPSGVMVCSWAVDLVDSMLPLWCAPKDEKCQLQELPVVISG